MLLLLSLTFLAAAAYLVGEVVTAPARQRASSVQRAASYGRLRRSQGGDETRRFRERVVDPLAHRLAAVVLRVNPRTTVELVAARLLAAGLGQRISPANFLALKAAATAGGAIFGLVLGSSSGALTGLLLLAAFGATGFVGPDFLVSTRARSRREAIRAELPDALDLLAVSVEAGLGFDGAVTKVTEHTTGPLAEELALTLGEMRVGEGRAEALKKLAERVPAPEMGAFVRSLIQADQLGISLGRILRVQAADARLRRQAAAEERAMKTPIKMLFPTVLFIFPAMFLVILGPAMLNLQKVF
jgi:tight adherence protein C